MCGLAVLAFGRGAAAPDEAQLRAMIKRLHHRGPDGRVVQMDGQVGLAHARLSIIDVEGGWQPITNEDDSVRVVFNGEIFNHIELRAGLIERGHVFRTQSDTEVIVHLYEEHGDTFMTHLNGQFAIALHDRRRKRLLLARDRVGIRPMFYSVVGARLAVASEVKALFALPWIERRFDAQALGEIFSLWTPLEPRCAFAGVSQLAPAHYLTVELDAPELRLQVHRYWDWDFARAAVQSGRDDDSLADELHALLLDSVRLQLRSDVPVGAYLSGGLDSSAIAALVAAQSSAQLRTFSLTFADAEFDEREHQRVMSKQLGNAHSEIEVRAGDIAGVFRDVVLHAEQPIVRTAPAPMLLLARHVRESGYKVVLTGEGADEIFAGYDVFKEARIRRFMLRQPDSKWRGRILDRLYPYLRHSPVRSPAFSAQFFRADGADAHDPWFALGPRMRSTQRVLRFLSAELRERIARSVPEQSLGELLPPAFPNWRALARDQYTEARTLMSGYLLGAQGDRMSMAHSVEGRYPFLDHRLIEFAATLPERCKLRGLQEKWLLKHAMRGRLPRSIIERTKQPYRAPESASFFNAGAMAPEIGRYLDDEAVAASGLFDRVAVRHLVEKCRAGRAIGFPDNMAFVGILSMQILQQEMIDAG